MPSYIYDTFLKDTFQPVKGPRPESVDWLRNQIKKIKNITPNKVLINGERSTSLTNQSVGKMYFFNYDPKLKMELPYYDTFPLIFPIQDYHDGFLGINLHYLPYPQRFELLRAMYSVINNQNYDETTKLLLSYKILKETTAYKLYKPCLKKYLFDYVKSPFLYINPDEWELVLLLPLARFQKQNINTIWKESLLKANAV